MSAPRPFTLRMPRAWIGRLDSQIVRRWLHEWCAHPTPQLPADPGAGDYRASFTLSKRQLHVASGLLDASESAVLRRIVASKIGSLPPLQSSFTLSALRRAPVLPTPHVVPAWRRVPEFGGWIPLRSLDGSAKPASLSGVVVPVANPTAPSESWGLVEWAALIGVAIIAVWGLGMVFVHFS